MDPFIFAITVILVTASGALAPGPLFFATLIHGSRSGAKGGLVFSLSHTVIEFSLVMLFALGLLTVASEPIVQKFIGVAGGTVLIFFGLYQIKNVISTSFGTFEKPQTGYRRLFLIGLVFSGLNPYFIVWWLSVGGQLIILALQFAGLLGVIFMYICHIWMDYVWLGSIAYFSHKGINILQKKGYRILLGIFAIVLIYFGVIFIHDIL